MRAAQKKLEMIRSLYTPIYSHCRIACHDRFILFKGFNMPCLSRRTGASLFALLIAVPLPVFAANSSATVASDDTDAIVVTARRRNEYAQKVPAALSVVTGATLDKSRTVNLSLLTQLVPEINYSSPNPRNTAFTIRGLGSSVVAISQANDGLEPGVGFYVNQVYHARPATAAFDFTDIDQIEVLRGPQGTLFGKNTTAGAINITTRAPAFNFGANEELSIGDQGFVQAKLSATGPLIEDRVAFRLSGAITRRDGSIYNARYNRWQNNTHTDAVRAQLLFRTGDDFSYRLIADYANFANECCTQVYVRVAPTLKPVAQQYAALAAGQNYVPPSTNPYDRVTDIDAGLGVDTNEGGVTGIGEWKLGGDLSLTSVTAWRYWNWDAANDRDYTGLHIQTTQHIPSRQDQYSQELRLAGKRGDSLDYVTGAYYFRQVIVGHPISIYGPLATYWLLPAGRPANLLDGYGSDGRTDFRTDSYGLFGEATWRPAPRWALTAGIRYTDEQKEGLYDVTVSGGLTTGLTASLQSDKASILRAQSYRAALNDASASGRVNVAYDLSDRMMVYTSYARGEKSGGINMSGLPVYPVGVPGHASGDAIEETKIVRPEKNSTWEAGYKFASPKLTLNATAYFTEVRDYQANVVDNAAVVALRSYLANIPKVTVKGVELESLYRPTANLSFRAAVAHSDGRYESYANGPCPIELTGSSTARCDLSGKGMPGLPKWAASLSGDYSHPLTTGSLTGDGYLRIDASTKSKVYGDATGSAYTVIDGYSLVNASLGFRSSKGWELALFARNLFDENYLQNVTVQAGNSGLIVGTPGEPRLIGVTLKLRQ
jgi:iron complex outermembrane recepter protein